MAIWNFVLVTDEEMESMGAAISELQQDLAKMTQQMQMLESRKKLKIL